MLLHICLTALSFWLFVEATQNASIFFSRDGFVDLTLFHGS
jgi:hypothetical protein